MKLSIVELSGLEKQDLGCSFIGGYILFQEKGNGFVVIRNYLLKIMNHIFELLILRNITLENGLNKQKLQG
ncbi:Uncharacterised protein [Streptococcus pneumoniae]|nr:Uncharacterised protein [Streptococcus pneumoniae]